MAECIHREFECFLNDEKTRAREGNVVREGVEKR